MPIVSGTVVTYSLKGIREDLADRIYDISPTDTPFMSMAGRETADNTLFEWQVDSLAAAVSSNQVVEGNESTFATPAFTTRLGNYTNISEKTLIVSATADRVRKAGRAKEKAYQLAKRSKEIKRDMEKASLENLAAAAGDSSNPRISAGLGAFVKTNSDFGATGSDPIYTSIPTDPRNDGTLRTFTEAMLKTVAQEVYVSGGDVKFLLLPPALKPTFSGFAGVATKTFYQSAVEPTSIIGSADVYVSDWGKISVIVDRFQRARDAWLIDPEYVSFAYLRGFDTSALAKTGDASKSLLNAEWGLKVKNEAALGIIADLQP